MRDAARELLLRAAGLALPPVEERPLPPEPRVLLIRPDHLGDVLLTAPAVGLLERSLPRTQLTYLVSKGSAEVAQHGVQRADVRTTDFPGFARLRNRHPLAPYRHLAILAATLRREQLDAAVVFRPDHWWGALLARAAGIPRRFGFSTRLTTPSLTAVLPVQRHTHAAEESLRLARYVVDALGGTPLPGTQPLFALSADDRRRAAAVLSSLGVPAERLVLLHASAGAPLKSWPVDRWALLVRSLRGAGCTPLLSGGPGDGPLLDAITQQAGPTARLEGQSLGVLGAVLERCQLAVGPDNGPLHIAAAVGTPTVRLYGPAPVARFGPWPGEPSQRALVTDRLPCVPCGNLVDPPCQAAVEPPCMLALRVESVLAATLQVVEYSGGGSRSQP